MIIKTADTVYEIVRSWNPETNAPVVPANFTSKIYRNGVELSLFNINISLTDSLEGIYTFSWSASTVGTYQMHVENNTTDVIYVSEIYKVKTDSEVDPSTKVYVGL